MSVGPPANRPLLGPQRSSGDTWGEGPVWRR